MPGLNYSAHVNSLRDFKKRNSLPYRFYRAFKEVASPPNVYGLQWGDPDVFEPLRFVRDRYVLPYVNPEHVGVEIGPGGGRWTRYLLDFRKLHVVDYHSELLDEVKKSFNRPNMRFIKNNGCDFPGVEEESVDFLFSFGCFVHLDAHLIDGYLKNIRAIVKPGANVLIQYSDKSKIMAQIRTDFSDTRPEQIRQMVLNSGFRILEEDLTTMWHSSIVRFTR